MTAMLINISNDTKPILPQIQFTQTRQELEQDLAGIRPIASGHAGNRSPAYTPFHTSHYYD